MNHAVIFGAGQGGRMALRLLSGAYRPLCFCDNNPAKDGSVCDGLPVCLPAKVDWQRVSLVIVATLNRDAGAEIEAQLRQLGYTGQLRQLTALRQVYDARLAVMRLLAQELDEVPGAVAELGVFQGAFAAELNRCLPDRPLYLFDTFEGFDARDVAAEQAAGYSRARVQDFSETSMERVRAALPHPEQAVFCKGYFPETIPDKPLQFALVSLDPDLYEPVYAGLTYFYPRLSPGGALIIHDYNSTQFAGVAEAVRRYCREHRLYPVPLCDLHGTAVLRKP